MEEERRREGRFNMKGKRSLNKDNEMKRVQDRALLHRQHVKKGRNEEKELMRGGGGGAGFSLLTESPDRAALGKLHLRCS